MLPCATWPWTPTLASCRSMTMLRQCGLSSSLTSSSRRGDSAAGSQLCNGNASQAVGGLLLVRILRGAVSEKDPSSWPNLCCELDSPRAPVEKFDKWSSCRPNGMCMAPANPKRAPHACARGRHRAPKCCAC